ncbi:hypothetical protein GH714_019015 [Hevea brasiliensis]|uniref:Protein kinase domain-containing protein n=1 Tax=Hevea brasiliensis TaxID=3981 RepID=A0A6A6NCC7_HEVBR|nr:hypothetical protein GH714_019015 [Hevea brasiliensis]
MKHHPNCPPFPCGKLGEIKFPFTNSKRPPHCGLLTVEGCDNGVQKIKLERGGRWYEISSISQAEAISIDDKMFSELLNSRNCRAFKYLNLPNLPYLSFQISQNLTLFECNNKLSDHPSLLEYSGCNNSSIYYTEREILPSLPPQCSLIQLPQTQNGQDDIFTQLTANFSLEVHVHWACRRCYYRGGDCQVNSKQKFYCANAEEGNNKFRLKFGLGADLELGGAYFGVPLFSYTELEEATSNFDSRKELGDGGFGTVYYGKLRDGREVAVKRLHRHEINLANLAVNRIQKCEFDELIDPSFGYNSVEEVKTMTITVAELAFRCLQQDKEMRPTMDEVLEELKRIESAEFRENPEEIHDDNKPLSDMLPPSSPPDCDDASLLKNIRSLPSPDTVTAKWASSCSTTPNVSGKIFSLSAA